MPEPYTPTEMELRQAWVSRQAIRGELTNEVIVRGQDEFDRFLARERREALAGYVRKPSREDVYRTLREVGLGLGLTEGMRHQVLNDATDTILTLLERTDR